MNPQGTAAVAEAPMSARSKGTSPEKEPRKGAGMGDLSHTIRARGQLHEGNQRVCGLRGWAVRLTSVLGKQASVDAMHWMCRRRDALWVRSSAGP